MGGWGLGFAEVDAAAGLGGCHTLLLVFLGEWDGDVGFLSLVGMELLFLDDGGDRAWDVALCG